MRVYAYCLSDEIEEGEFEVISGVAGATARLIETEGIVSVVSNFPENSIAVTRENVLAHERVVRNIFRKASLLPFRFGTVIADARLLDFISSQKSTLSDQLERVRGSVEMSVKVVLPDEVNASEALQTKSGEEEDRTVSGTEYLKRKRREILVDEEIRERAGETARWLTEKLQGAASDSVVTALPSGSTVLAISFLVRRERADEYRKLLNRARAERPGLHFLTSGPWPPYSFSNINS
ncbi:MAG: hypothetical protein AUG51_19805 [Acidobacteria bacterium 13_1_20CM_3_53_8]|nr:MAG: hypothetical protein AUG51_19805 [Acidobacteria bacterium 13_1_20CM_3_53_8]